MDQSPVFLAMLLWSEWRSTWECLSRLCHLSPVSFLHQGLKWTTS